MECVKPDRNGEHIASGSWDGQLKVWTIGSDKSTTDEAVAEASSHPSKGATKVCQILSKTQILFLFSDVN